VFACDGEGLESSICGSAARIWRKLFLESGSSARTGGGAASSMVDDDGGIHYACAVCGYTALCACVASSLGDSCKVSVSASVPRLSRLEHTSYNRWKHVNREDVGSSNRPKGNRAQALALGSLDAPAPFAAIASPALGAMPSP
jgi:hypothetical protein